MGAFVMVPLDGSPLAEQALPLGISLTRNLGGVLLLLHVLPPASADAECEEMQQYLTRLEHLVAKAGLSVVSALREGPVAETITEMANTEPVSHVVMSTHGRSGLTRWTLGSVTNGVLQLTKQPLLLVRPLPDHYRDLFPLPDIARIVVALDGSPLAESALPHATKLARLYGAELLLFRAVTAHPLESAGAGVSVLAEMHDQLLQEESDAYLEHIAEIVRGDGLAVRYESGVAPPAEAIQAYAQRVGADLIAMTTHVRGGVGRMILGSITDQVVRLGDVPVMVTRPPMEHP